MAIVLTSYGGVSVGTGTAYKLVARIDADWADEADVTIRDRDGDSPIVDGQRMRPVDRGFFVRVGDTSPPANRDEWRQNAAAIFKADGVPRALRGTWRGVTLEIMATVVRIGNRAGMPMRASGSVALEGVFRFADPVWRAVTATGPDSASPITVGGNAEALPVYTVTGDTTEVFRRRVTVTDVLGYGFSGYPIMAEFDTTAGTTLTTADFIAFQNGREIPIYVVNPDNAATRVFFLADCLPGGSTPTDIYYGSSVPVSVTQQALDPAGMAWTDASFSNTNWVWDDWIVSDNPTNRCGVWTLSRTEDDDALAKGISVPAESASSLVWTATVSDVTEPIHDGVTMVIGGAVSGSTNALSGVSRAFSNITLSAQLQFRVDYYRVTDLDIQTALAETGDAVTNTTAIDIDSAAVIILRARMVSTAPAETQTITMTNSGDFALILTSNPTVSVAAAVTARVIDDSLDVGSNTLDFDRVFVDNVAITVDCLNRTVTPASGPLYARDLVFSNQRRWLPMAVGAATWTEPDNSAVTVTVRDSYVLV